MTGYVAALRAEAVKFRTAPGRVIGAVAASAAIVVLAVLPGVGGSCGTRGPGSECVPTEGPGGEEVTDAFTFAHRPLAGDGSVTVRVTALATQVPTPGVGMEQRVVPWAKAGLLIKDGVGQGSHYAAVLVTEEHGVRFQYDYTHDVAGGASGVASGGSRWLRLSRAADVVTAEESSDGERWATVGSVELPTLPATAEVGLFVTSPQWFEEVGDTIVIGMAGAPSQATATFDRLALGGAWADTATADDDGWRFDVVGGSPGGSDGVGGGDAVDDADGPPIMAGAGERDGEVFRLTGSGDIAPAVVGAAGGAQPLTLALAGSFIGLIVMVVVGVVSATSEYRTGLIRTTFTAGPDRLRVLAAKVTVIGTVTFVAGLLAAGVAMWLGPAALRANGAYVQPAPLLTQVRMVVGTAAVLAGAAVMALGLGLVLRRGATAVTTAVLSIVLPYLLAISVLPVEAARWALRVSPAAAFAVQQASREYPQVANLYSPASGYFPLSPVGGCAVLVAWTALTLAAAAVLLQRRDV